MGALIFGTDAVSEPDAVSLPTDNDYWFTQGNGTTVNGTQVPAYWTNKIGGELDTLIRALGGTIDMTVRDQLKLLILALVSLIPPGKAGSGTGVMVGPGYNQTISGGFTTLFAGYAVCRAKINPSYAASGFDFACTLSSNLTSDTSADTTQLTQYHELAVPIAAGQSVTFSLNVTGTAGSGAAVAVTYDIYWYFQATPAL